MKDTFQNTTPTSWLLISEKVIICSLTKLCPTLCDPKDWSTPGIPVLHYHPEFAQIYVHWIGDSMQPSHPFLPLFLLSSVFPSFSIFSNESAIHPISQTIRTSVSTSVFPMTIQGWFPLKLTGLIYLLFKGLSRVFSSKKIQIHQFFNFQPSIWPNSHMHPWLLVKP